MIANQSFKNYGDMIGKDEVSSSNLDISSKNSEVFFGVFRLKTKAVATDHGCNRLFSVVFDLSCNSAKTAEHLSKCKTSSVVF